MKIPEPLLLEQFRRGNQKSLKILYDSYFDSLFLFGQKYINNQDAVEDIVQEAFIKVWEKRATFFHESVLKSFLYKTVRNACFNYLEHQKVCKTYEKQESKEIRSNDFFLRNVIEEEVNSIIAETIQKLPDSSRLIYLLSLKGLKNTEIAEDLDISINTVKTQKQRASKFLKEKLKDVLTGLFLL